ncbi:alpha/beta hydrolase [Hoeflea sp. CAU 1731]
MPDFDEKSSLESPTQATLNLLHMKPVQDCRAIVQINHGMGEHASRYAHFASFLAKRGFAVYAHDHRGHGETVAPGISVGMFGKGPSGENWKLVIADVLAVNEHARQRYADVPVITFGHSMGAAIAFNFALSHPGRQAGLAAWNHGFAAGLPARTALAILSAERMLKGSDTPSRILQKLTIDAWAAKIKDRKIYEDWLSHNAESNAAYAADPLCTGSEQVSISMWRDVIAMNLRAADPKMLQVLPKKLPVYLTGGGQDAGVENGKAIEVVAKRMQAAGMEKVSSRIYENMRHETLNETAEPGARQVMIDFVSWAEGIPELA